MSAKSKASAKFCEKRGLDKWPEPMEVDEEAQVVESAGAAAGRLILSLVQNRAAADIATELKKKFDKITKKAWPQAGGNGSGSGEENLSKAQGQGADENIKPTQEPVAEAKLVVQEKNEREQYDRGFNPYGSGVGVRPSGPIGPKRGPRSGMPEMPIKPFGSLAGNHSRNATLLAPKPQPPHFIPKKPMSSIARNARVAGSSYEPGTSSTNGNEFRCRGRERAESNEPEPGRGAGASRETGQGQGRKPTGPRRGSPKRIPMELPLSQKDEDKYLYSANGGLFNDSHAIGCFVSPEGYYSIRFQDGIRVDITMDQAVRVLNPKASVMMAMDKTGHISGLRHPTGSMYQYGSRVEVCGMDDRGILKFAKCSYKGISFSSDQNALIFLCDASGTKTCNDTFSDLSGDITSFIFHHESTYGPEYVQELITTLHGIASWYGNDMSENYVINGFRVSMSNDGCVRVSKLTDQLSKIMFRTSTMTSTTLVTTPFVHCTASKGPKARHIYVKRGERRVHFDGQTFIVRNAAHSSGIDEHNVVQLYM